MKKWNRRKMNETAISTKLSPGIRLYDKVSPKKEDIYYLAVKGLMIFLLVFGNIGGFLSAFEMEYNVLVFATAIFLGAVFFSLIYYSGKVRDSLYILFFIVFIAVSIRYRRYINSGFYAIINEMTLTITDYLEIKGANEYSEFFSNRYLTVTATACFLGLIDALLMNITMLVRIRRFTSVLISATVFLVPLYFEKEPELIYVCCTMAGLGSMMVMKAGEHYRSMIKVPKKEKIFFGMIDSIKRKKKKEEYLLSYRRSYRNCLQSMIVCFLISAITISGMQMVFPKENFKFEHSENSWKTVADEKLAVAWQYGFEALWNHQSAGGGIGKGDLSGGASVRPNYETDLILTLAPYTMDTIYLKAYTGVIYGDNRWQELQTPEDVDKTIFAQAKFQGESMAQETELLALNYETKQSFKVAKGKMKVKNVGADEEFLYYPYYTQFTEENIKEDKALALEEENTYIYYPRFENVFQGEPGSNVDDIYLKVPKENYKVIEEFCRNAELKGSPLEQAERVIWYFRQNIPYTVRPGALPPGEDAVNYFLTKNKKGYCSHFASAATLIFRYLGIPARYVEGYAVDAEEIRQGEILKEPYKDYYEGYSVVGETAVVQVQVTDASAHAWVEIYLKDFGWVPVEVTVSDSIDYDMYNGFGQWFGSLFSGGNGGGTDLEETEREQVPFVDIQIDRINILMIIFLAVVFLMCGFRTLQKLSFRYQKKEKEKLLGEYILLCNFMRLLEPDFCTCITHKEQWEKIADRIMNGENSEEIAQKLESISYGNESVEDEEMEKLENYIRDLEKQLWEKSRLREKIKMVMYFFSAKKI